MYVHMDAVNPFILQFPKKKYRFLYDALIFFFHENLLYKLPPLAKTKQNPILPKTISYYRMKPNAKA